MNVFGRSLRLIQASLRIFCVGLLVTSFTACGGGGSAAAPVTPGSSVTTLSDIANPPEVASANGVVNLTLNAEINPLTGAPGIQWNTQFVPPTIRVAPGDTINITYVNQLPTSTVEPFNATNLHFHGLHVSPNPPSDDSIDLLAMPGQTLHYSITIPANHPTGVFWYHSHSHGEANWQVFNSMSGAIVITGSQAFAPQAAGLPERVIMLRNVLSQPTYASTLVRPGPPGADLSCSSPFDIPGEVTTVNGRSAGSSMSFETGQPQYWRVVNASSDGFYDLSVDGASLSVLGIDGVPVNAYPGGSTKIVSDVVIPPAGRAEFIVNNIKAGASLRTTCYDTGSQGNPNPTQSLATFAIGSTTSLPTMPSVSTRPATGIWSQAYPAYTVQRTLAFTVGANGLSLNNIPYSANGGPMFTAQAGTIEQWTLTNAMHEVHAFHIHQIHFMVEDIDGVAQGPVLRDTFIVPAAHADGTPSVSHVLLDFRDPIIRGTFLFHCHLLEHEDAGMMAKMQVN